MKKLFSVLIIFALILSGCADNSSSPISGTNAPSEGSNAGSVSTAAPAEVDFDKSSDEMFTARDLEVGYDETTSVIVELNGDSVSASSNSVVISGTTVKLTEEATYIISGTLNDGMIVVDAADTAKLRLVFAGVNITSAESAPLYILGGDKVFITLAADTENSLANGGTFTAIDDNNIDGALFSKQDLTINGVGSLAVTSPAGHGIVCKDDLVLIGGAVNITSASHGIDANDSVRISEASLTVAAGKDGIHAENSDDVNLGFVYISGGTFDIDAEGDGISAAAYMQIEDGTFDIVTGGGAENAEDKTSDMWGDMPGGMGGMGSHGGMGGNRPGMPRSGDTVTTSAAADTEDDSSTSIKGLKSAGSMLIAGGAFTMDCADDAVHSNASVTLNGGTFEIATGDDGFHADETLTVTAGKINITESYEGLEALNIAVQGGEISLKASDDGLNAAGGTDESGFGGLRGDEQFGGMGGMMAPGGMGGSSNGSIVISGGDLYVNASGDGIDANGYLEITGGYTVVVGPTQGDTATLDYDTSATISGGTFIGTGASGMAQTFSDSEQGVIAVSVGSQTAGTTIALTDKSGKTVIEYAPELNFAVVILSSPDIVSGETYTINVGSQSADFAAN